MEQLRVTATSPPRFGHLEQCVARMPMTRVSPEESTKAASDPLRFRLDVTLPFSRLGFDDSFPSRVSWSAGLTATRSRSNILRVCVELCRPVVRNEDRVTANLCAGATGSHETEYDNRNESVEHNLSG
jgi:hypothetical protein